MVCYSSELQTQAPDMEICALLSSTVICGCASLVRIRAVYPYCVAHIDLGFPSVSVF